MMDSVSLTSEMLIFMSTKSCIVCYYYINYFFGHWDGNKGVGRKDEANFKLTATVNDPHSAQVQSR